MNKECKYYINCNEAMSDIFRTEKCRDYQPAENDLDVLIDKCIDSLEKEDVRKFCISLVKTVKEIAEIIKRIGDKE
jgi:hypothetical protein